MIMVIGKTEVLSSGFGTSNSYAYTPKVTILGFHNNALLLDYLGPGSGIGYIVRGYPLEGFARRKTLISGQILNSGDSAYMTLSDPYEQVDVGLVSVQSNNSGAVTVFTTGKRR
jgi:hypothetical protein